MSRILKDRQAAYGRNNRTATCPLRIPGPAPLGCGGSDAGDKEGVARREGASVHDGIDFFALRTNRFFVYDSSCA